MVVQQATPGENSNQVSGFAALLSVVYAYSMLFRVHLYILVLTEGMKAIKVPKVVEQAK